jgi:maltose/moltooligosaccharide transporter
MAQGSIATPTLSNKPKLSLWQIWNMSFGFLGIQFGWGLQMANMSAIYQFLGADESQIPLLWLAAPLTGLIVQPIVGYYSDRTWGKLGRRRPYFLVGAILASIALVLMPNSSTLWMAAGLLWILDASVNISMEPFRAFVGDMLPGQQRKMGFAMQSVLIGAGAVLASIMPFVLTEGFGVSAEATTESAIPPAVHLAFYIGAALFFAAVLYTILTTREYPPDDMEAFLREKKEGQGVGKVVTEIVEGIKTMPKTMKQLAVVQFFTWFALFCMWLYFVPSVATAVFGGETLGVKDENYKEWIKNNDSDDLMASAFASAQAYEKLKEEKEASMKGKQKTGLGVALGRMLGLSLPRASAAENISAQELAGVLQAGLNARNTEAPEEANPLVTTIAESLYRVNNGTDIREAAGYLENRLSLGRAYQRGASWGGVCFAAYNLIAFGFSFLLLYLVKVTSAKKIHLVCLLLGALGLISAAFIQDQYTLIISMVGIGIAWASILSMPYAMLSNSIPGEKMGFYMGVFNFFIVLPQILASVGLGPIVEFGLKNQSVWVVVIGGISMVIAAISVLGVNEQDTEFEGFEGFQGSSDD